jgi:hypothetical protein
MKTKSHGCKDEARDVSRNASPNIHIALVDGSAFLEDKGRTKPNPEKHKRMRAAKGRIQPSFMRESSCSACGYEDGRRM